MYFYIMYLECAGCSSICSTSIASCFYQLCSVAIVISVLQMKKLRKAKWLAQSHTAKVGVDAGNTTSNLLPKLVVVTTTPCCVSWAFKIVPGYLSFSLSVSLPLSLALHPFSPPPTHSKINQVSRYD